MLPTRLFDDLYTLDTRMSDLEVLEERGFYMPFAPRNTLMPYSATTAAWITSIINDLTVLEYGYWWFINGANSGADYWEFKLEKNSTPASTIHTFSTVGLGSGTYIYNKITNLPFTRLFPADKGLTVQLTKNGAAGTLFMQPVVYVVP